jgi:hypothetical protein
MAELIRDTKKKNIQSLFSGMQNRKFDIPDYQRPYAWDIDLCTTLWNDIVENFAEAPDKEYFLGTIVVFGDEDSKNLVVIDGQQRITTFFLLLRALYKKIEEMTPTVRNKLKKLEGNLESCIWDTDDKSGEVTDKRRVHIESSVITDNDKTAFLDILEKGVAGDKAKDNYSINYQYFKKQCDDFSMSDGPGFEDLCLYILGQCIVLPIECDGIETALTIFTTLNDRGLPLADSDIFKSQIYKNRQTDDEKKEFTREWKEISQYCKDPKLPIDAIFRFYMHVIRAETSDGSREVGLRRFYARDKYGMLKRPGLVQEIKNLAKFWMFVNELSDPDPDEDKYSISDDAKKWLHCLSCYPNEYWKYPVSVYFLKNRESLTFDDGLCRLLKKLIALLFSKFVDVPTINTVRDDIYAVYISIDKCKPFPVFKFDRKFVTERLLAYAAPRLVRALLLLDAYLTKGQNSLIPEKFHIEHILPAKWKDSSYQSWDENDKEVEIYLEKFGNKVVCEYKINIQAGNGYFGRKRKRYYINSKIAAVQKLQKMKQDEWSKEDIDKRENEFVSRIMSFFEEQLAGEKT